MNEIEIITTYYEAVHGDMPHHSKKQDWTFQPCRSLGRRPVIMEDCTLKQAKENLKVWAGDIPIDGAFTLLP